MKNWEQEEIDFLKKNYSTLGPKSISEILGKTYYQVRRKARKYKLFFIKKYNWKYETDFLIENINSIVDYKKIILTYSKNFQESAWNYIKAKKLRSKNKTHSEISNILELPYQTIKNWASKTTPRPVKAIIKLTEIGFLPLLPVNSRKFETFLKIFASIFGDGSLNKNLNSIIISGDTASLKKFENEINQFLPMFQTKIEEKHTKGRFDNRIIEGISGVLTINDANLSRLLFASGAPKGDKVIQKINFPNWIFKLTKKQKSIFLGTLWSQDGTKPLWSEGGFHLSFQLSKSVSLKKEHRQFMNSMRKLMREFGINTGKVKWQNKPYMRNKDSSVIDKSYFNISSILNYIRFSKFIPNYSEDRKEIIEHTLHKVKLVIEKNKERMKIFRKAKAMQKENKSIKESSKILRIPYSTVKTWYRDKHKPIDILRR